MFGLQKILFANEYNYSNNTENSICVSKHIRANFLARFFRLFYGGGPYSLKSHICSGSRTFFRSNLSEFLLPSNI